MHDIRHVDAAATRPEHIFYFAMACVFATIAVAGFTSSYLTRVAGGTFQGPPLVHLHGLLLFAWTAMYLAQTALVAGGQTMRHRAWGLAGIALFSVMICATAAMIIRATNAAELRGGPGAATAIGASSFASLALVSALFATAIANVKRPDVHKRLMLLVMVVLVQAAVARLIVRSLIAGPPGPPTLPTILATALITDLLIAAAIVHDWRTRKRVHPVYLWGGLLVLIVQLAVPIFANSAPVAAAVAVLRSLGA